MTRSKEHKQLTFKTLEQGIAEPGEFLLSDFSKLERSALLHVGFQALDAFQVHFMRPVYAILGVRRLPDHKHLPLDNHGQ